MRFLIFFLLFATSVLSHETIFPYDYFKTQAIYHLNTGQIIYVEKTPHGQTLWEKNQTFKANINKNKKDFDQYKKKNQ